MTGARRIRMTVRYDGTDFAGSQLQPGRRTVAGTLTAGLKEVLQAPVHLLFASRTDAGVHAEGNVCTFDADLPFPVNRLPAILAPGLPPDLFIRDAHETAPDFHPRFDAVARHYVYRLYRSRDVPVDRYRYVASYNGNWENEVVQSALALLSGKRSFQCFAKGVENPEDAICQLQPILTEESGLEVCWHFWADRFLRHMICRIVGAVLAVADQRMSILQLGTMLSGEATYQVRPAPPQGLTLIKAEYAKELHR